MLFLKRDFQSAQIHPGGAPPWSENRSRSRKAVLVSPADEGLAVVAHFQSWASLHDSHRRRAAAAALSQARAGRQVVRGRRPVSAGVAQDSPHRASGGWQGFGRCTHDERGRFPSIFFFFFSQLPVPWSTSVRRERSLEGVEYRPPP